MKPLRLCASASTPAPAASRMPTPRRAARTLRIDVRDTMYYVQGFIYTRVCTHCTATAHGGGLFWGCRCFMQSWNSFITCLSKQVHGSHAHAGHARPLPPAPRPPHSPPSTHPSAGPLRLTLAHTRKSRFVSNARQFSMARYLSSHPDRRITASTTCQRPLGPVQCPGPGTPPRALRRRARASPEFLTKLSRSLARSLLLTSSSSAAAADIFCC